MSCCNCENAFCSFGEEDILPGQWLMKYSFEFGALSFDHFFYELFWITKLQLQTVQFSVLKQLIVLEQFFIWKFTR